MGLGYGDCEDCTGTTLDWYDVNGDEQTDLERALERQGYVFSSRYGGYTCPRCWASTQLGNCVDCCAATNDWHVAWGGAEWGPAEARLKQQGYSLIAESWVCSRCWDTMVLTTPLVFPRRKEGWDYE